MENTQPQESKISIGHIKENCKTIQDLIKLNNDYNKLEFLR